MIYPITPYYMSIAPAPLIKLYNELELEIFRYICSQLYVSASANSTTAELIRILQRRGIDMKNIEYIIKKVLNLTDSEFDALFDDLIARNQQYYNGMLSKSGMLGDSYRLDAIAKEIEAIRLQTKGTFINITQTMGFMIRNSSGQLEFTPLSQAFDAVLDKAFIRTWSGADGYNKSIRSAINELANSGIVTVDYASGKVDRIEVAVRRAVNTGITQVSAKYADNLMDELDTEYMEITAHRGARDKPGPSPWSSHKAWQGKVYSKSSGDIYPNVYAVCGWGQVDGLEGINCRHLHYPFVPGVSERTYTDEELANIDPPPFEYQGQQYTAYEATQKQRALETSIRKSTRRKEAAKAAGLDYTDESARLKRLKSEYNAFSNAAQLPMRPERTYTVN